MEFSNVISVTLAIVSTLSSVYLWVRERSRQVPRLSASWSGRNFHWLGKHEVEGGRIRHRFELEIFVANLSTQPDVLLDLRFRVRSREGWLRAKWLCPENDRSEWTYLPLDLGPRCTVPIYVDLEVETGPEVTDDLPGYLATPTMQLEVELVGLGSVKHLAIAVEPAETSEVS